MKNPGQMDPKTRLLPRVSWPILSKERSPTAALFHLSTVHSWHFQSKRYKNCPSLHRSMTGQSACVLTKATTPVSRRPRPDFAAAQSEHQDSCARHLRGKLPRSPWHRVHHCIVRCTAEREEVAGSKILWVVTAVHAPLAIFVVILESMGRHANQGDPKATTKKEEWKRLKIEREARNRKRRRSNKRTSRRKYGYFRNL